MTEIARLRKIICVKTKEDRHILAAQISGMNSFNSYISATDRPIDVVFDPRVFGDGGSIGPTSGYITSKMAAVDDVIT